MIKQKSFIDVNIEKIAKMNQNKIQEKQQEVKCPKTQPRILDARKSQGRKRLIEAS